MSTEPRPVLPTRDRDAEFELVQLGQWVDTYGDQKTWPQLVHLAYAEAVAKHRDAVRAGDNWLESPLPEGGAQ